MKEAPPPAPQAELEAAIEYTFKDRALLEKALTHSSFCNETKEAVSDYERLEFLGDAIISTVVAESAYRLFADAREGELTRLKSVVIAEPCLAKKARELSLTKYLRLGHGAATADRAAYAPGVQCDAFEALVGAIYLDGGFETASRFVNSQLAPELTAAREEGRQVDAKTDLQMVTYGTNHKPPTYQVIESTGPAHAPAFVVEVLLPDGRTFRGRGKSKKEAQQAAATLALKEVRENRVTEMPQPAPEAYSENSEGRNG
jgi:ribonuclease-3